MPLVQRGGTGGIISAIESGNSNLALIEENTNLSVLALKRSEVENGDVLPTSATGFSDTITSNETSLVAGFLAGETLTVNGDSKNLQISSTSTEDNSAGTGARFCNIRFLKDDGTLGSATVSLNGQTPVSITGSADLIAIGIFIVVTFGSGAPTDGTASNIGKLYVGLSGDTYTAGKPDTGLFGCVDVGRNTGQSGVLLCGSTTRLRLNRLQGMSAINGNDTAEIIFNSFAVGIGPNGVIFKNKYPLSVGSVIDLDLTLQLDLNGPCVFWVNADRTSGNGAVSIGCNVNAVLDSKGTST